MSGYLVGWKQISKFLGCNERTARRWHKVSTMPIIKMGLRNSSVRIEIENLKRWVMRCKSTVSV